MKIGITSRLGSLVLRDHPGTVDGHPKLKFSFSVLQGLEKVEKSLC